MKKLTKNQKKVLQYVERNLANKIYPTQKEMAEHFGVAQNAIYQRLNSLRKKGYLENCSLRRGTYLSDEYVASKEKPAGVPLVGGIAAGMPILADQNITEYMDVNSFIKKEHKDAFILKVAGDSMIDDNINDGDYIIVKPQKTIENGQIGVVLIEDEATVKRVFIKADKIILKPANPKYKEMVYRAGDKDVSIVGLVIGNFRNI
jgi:repressor LexA